MTGETHGDPRDWARTPGVPHAEAPVLTESRIPLITALFCGLLLHADVMAEDADEAAATGGEPNRRDGCAP